MFQSTHSLRSATTYDAKEINRYLVSIHALLAECDCEKPLSPVAVNGFNPRTPCGVRHEAGRHMVRTYDVSIHALLAECDLYYSPHAGTSGRFNPRTPCGVRQFQRCP